MNETNLHNYQNGAVAHILENDFCGLFLDMGLGKTVSSLTAIKKLIYDEVEINTVLVIAPKRVAESVWSAECDKWEHLKGLRVAKIIGNEKQRKAALREKADVYMLGRDNIVWLCGLYGGSMLPFDMLIIDESSSFKSPKSLRFKALKAAQPSFDRVVLLTGTPAPNGLIDLWSQIFLLDRGERLGKTITFYRDNFFSKSYNGFSYDLQQDAEERIHTKIKDVCLSMKAADYLDLPKRIDNFIKIQFPPELKKKYLDFEREKVLELLTTSEDITAMSAAGLSNKLLQFANGAVYDADKVWHAVHDLKLDAAEEVIESANGKPVLIAYTYKSDVERLLERLKKYKPKKLDSDQDIKDWNAGKIKVLLMHPASGGHGLNLQTGGHIALWFGQTWSLELYMQFNARLDRQGQTESVIINHLIAEGTHDEEVIKSLENKETRQEGLMKAVKAKIEKYKNNF